MISHIVCIDMNTDGIGFENDLIYHIQEDMKHFIQKTIHKKIIMGRKTFESILNKCKGPLKNRLNIVVSRDKERVIKENKECKYDNVKWTVNWQDEIDVKSDEEVIVIGGEQLYRATLPFTNKIYMTCVYNTTKDVKMPADTFYPGLNPYQWKHYEKTEPKIAEQVVFGKTILVTYNFITLRKIQTKSHSI